MPDNTSYGAGVYNNGVYQPYQVAPASIADPDQVGGPTVTQSGTVTPGSTGDPDTVGNPSIVRVVAPATTTDPDNVGAPSLTRAVAPAGITDPDSAGTPSLVKRVTPASIMDPDNAGAPQLGFTGSESYGLGPYGAGPYMGVPSNVVQPATIADSEEIIGPSVAFDGDPTNMLYGRGTYGKGPYYGQPEGRNNLRYGEGTYGYGDYYGYTLPGDDPGLLPAIRPYTGTPMHILGIGPWNPQTVWRGAANYGIQAGRRTSRPALALPPAQTLSFTLRLNEGSEARAELQQNRGDFILLDEMDTDLWWRRKDPRLSTVDMIGRFNTANVDVQTSDTGLTVSAQFEDYRTVLAERLVLHYKNPETKPNPESMWDEGTPITAIMAFALPGNTNIDLSEATGTNPANLGTTTQRFHLPPGTSIGDLFDNLLAISPQPWEWWIDTPASLNLPPKLRFASERGTNKGVVLYDVGGPTPIASWRRIAAADQYANALYYSGSEGGVVDVMQAEIEKYGQRDATDGNSTLGGDIKLITAAAARKLRQLASRQATYQLTLKPGYWRGPRHIGVGDTIAIRLRVGKELIKEQHRVTEIQADIDATGVEEVQLTLGTPPPSPDPRSKRSPFIRLLRYLKSYVPPDGALDVPDTT